MRKLLLIAAFSLLSVAGIAQTPTLQQKLYYTCKAWGFVKCYHSNVSNCNVNWDSVLISVLPSIENAATDSAFNDAIDTMLAAAGTMQLSTTYFPDTLAADLKRNRDWDWTDDTILRTDVQVQLDTIKNNFRPHPSCYTEYNTYTTSNKSYLLFPYDSIGLNVNSYTNYPDEDHRLLALFKYWNTLRYYNPYNYVLDIPWDTTLYNYVVPFADAGNSYSFFLLLENVATALNDAHVEGHTGSEYYFQTPGYYEPYLRLEYVDSQYVVLNSLTSSVKQGDAVVSVNGLTPAQWEDSLRPYLSAGNTSVFRRFVSGQMMARQTYDAIDTIILQDSSGAYHNFYPNSDGYPSAQQFYTGYVYPADSLDNILWTTLPCDIGYVNMGNMSDTDINAMYADLHNKSAIIFDVRNYPHGDYSSLLDMMYPNQLTFVKAMLPDITYPGTYHWDYGSNGYAGNAAPYTGKVIILMNEQAQSASEFFCMELSAMPNVVKVGSQTAGADGSTTYWDFTADISVGFTTEGIFYPNGDSTQRVGIVPDSVVYPTRVGISRHIDEVLDKALSIAGCNLSVKNVTTVPLIQVFPNPADDIVTVAAKNIDAGTVTITISDVTGRVLMRKETDNNSNQYTTSFNVKGFAAGMYFVNVQAGEQQYVTKLLKD